jgi:hypothetical protein
MGHLPAAILILMASGAKALAQSRMSDKDIESLMKNLQEKFQSSFNSAVQKDAKALVECFTKQTQGMFNQFKSNRKADQALLSAQDSANQIDKLLSSTAMGDQTNHAWARVRTELGTLSQQIFPKSP